MKSTTIALVLAVCLAGCFAQSNVTSTENTTVPPQTTASQTTAAPPKTTASQTTAAPPKTTASQTTAAPPKTTASQTTAAPPKTTASQTTAAPPKTTASQTTAAPPKTTASQTTAAPPKTTASHTTAAPPKTTTSMNTTQTSGTPSHATTPATTNMPMTTVKPVTKFGYPRTNSCITVESKLMFSVMYKMTDNSTSTVKVDFSTLAPSVSNGACPMEGKNGTMISSITIQFGANQSHVLTLTFEKNDSTGVEMMSSNTAVKFDMSDSSLFPNASVTGPRTANLIAAVQLVTKKDHFYQCMATQMYAAHNNVTFIMEDTKIKAFNEKATEPELCPEDVTTPKPPMTTTQPPQKGDILYYFKGKHGEVCILLEGVFTLHVDTAKVKEDITFSNMSMYHVSGQCGNSSQSIKLTYPRSKSYGYVDAAEHQYSAEFFFTKSSDKFSMSRVMVEFTPANASGKNDTLYANMTESSSMSVAMGQYYSCKTTQTLTSSLASLHMDLKDLRAAAFRSSNATSFGDNYTQCDLDNTSELVPIIVGAVLAGLVIIVLIAYLIGRQRTRHGYEQM